jgi:hypothetical protein
MTMKVETLCKLIKDYPTAIIMSDSGWECDPTDIGGIYYRKSENTIFLTQSGENKTYKDDLCLLQYA